MFPARAPAHAQPRQRTLRHFSHSKSCPFSLRPTAPLTSPSSPSSRPTRPTRPSAPPRPPMGRLLDGRGWPDADKRRRAREDCDGRRVLPCDEDSGELVGSGDKLAVGAIGIGVDCNARQWSFVAVVARIYLSRGTPRAVGHPERRRGEGEMWMGMGISRVMVAGGGSGGMRSCEDRRMWGEVVSVTAAKASHRDAGMARRAHEEQREPARVSNSTCARRSRARASRAHLPDTSVCAHTFLPQLAP